MDPITAGILSATLVPLAAGAAGEAGRQAWESLTSFVRDRFGRGSDADTAAQTLASHPGEVVHGEVLGRILEHGAATDEQIAAWLRTWLRDAGTLTGQPATGTSVTNTVSGHAQVHGPLIQTHTISGPITFGPPVLVPPPAGPSATTAGIGSVPQASDGAQVAATGPVHVNDRPVT
ncbi:hypothetical protein AB0M79_29080 [Polymorphospora sp. NPDC051019]|uniref:hypothetical protein n=1 Tax=Polymorphospora sp. NPDC051019 TaxID=3155725 RepID=UPI00342989A6